MSNVSNNGDLNEANTTIEYEPIPTSNEPIRLVDSTLLTKLDEILSAQIPVTVELPDGTKIPFDEYDQPLHRDGEVSVLADDDFDTERPKTRAALAQIAADGTIREDEIEAVLEQLEEMGGLTDSSVLLNVCKSDWGDSS